MARGGARPVLLPLRCPAPPAFPLALLLGEYAWSLLDDLRAEARRLGYEDIEVHGEPAPYLFIDRSAHVYRAGFCADAHVGAQALLERHRCAPGSIDGELLVIEPAPSSEALAHRRLPVRGWVRTPPESPPQLDRSLWRANLRRLIPEGHPGVRSALHAHLRGGHPRYLLRIAWHDAPVRYSQHSSIGDVGLALREISHRPWERVDLYDLASEHYDTSVIDHVIYLNTDPDQLARGLVIARI